MKRNLPTLFALALIGVALEGHALKMRRIPLRESVCQSDIIVVGIIHGVEIPAFSVVTSSRIGASYSYDRGQITRNPPKELRFLRDDPWRTTTGGVDVWLRSKWMGDLTDYFADSGEWIWLLHREPIVGHYFVLKRLALSEETSVSKILKEDRCGKA